MGLIEIALTIVAWRKGWGAKALIPLLGAFLFGVMLGVSAVANGGKPESVVGIGLIGDAIAIVVLGVMVANAPARTQTQAFAPVEPLPEPVRGRQMTA